MMIYLDDNRADKALASLLAKRGHRVVLPRDVGNHAAKDPVHFAYAIQQQLALLTADRDDFRQLHNLILVAGGKHPGLLFVAYDNDPTRDMMPKHIVSAVNKVQRSGLILENQIVVLNHWR